MTGLWRAVRSEFVKLPLRHPVWWITIPLAIAIPVVINVGIAKATQSDMLNTQGGMDTNNAAYWIIIFTTFILMLGGVNSACAEFATRSVDTYLAIQPRRWVLPAAKLTTFGLIAVVASEITTFGVMWLLPKVFPDVWGRVEVFSGDGVRLLVGLPALALCICALGIGLSMLVRRAGLVVMLVLLWKFGVEVFVVYLPGDVGTTLQRLSPFKNGEIGAGQLPTFDTFFGNATGSLLYFAAACALIFVAGVIRFSVRDVPSD